MASDSVSVVFALRLKRWSQGLSHAKQMLYLTELSFWFLVSRFFFKKIICCYCC